MTTLLAKRAVARKVGVNERSIDRYADDPKYQHLNFPRPAEINNRRFWVEAEVEAWLQESIAVRTAAPRSSESAAA